VRVLLISGSLPPMKCGIGDYTEKLAEALSARPDVTAAVLTDVAASSAPPGRHFEILPVAHGWKFSDAPAILRAAREWKPDIAHMQFPTQGYGRSKLPWLLPAILAASGLRVVQTWHEYVQQDSLPAFKHSVLNLPNALAGGGLAVVRPNYLDRMAPWYRALVAGKRFRYIPNAPSIPVTEWSEDERRAKRAELAPRGETIVAYFGFAYPAKGVEQLFEIADPARHRLVLICDLDRSDAYQRSILERVAAPDWAGRVLVTGFRSADEASRILAAADAAVFPFREGGGDWNTTLQGAAAQGTFVLTTSRERHGDDAPANTYFARVDDVREMRRALIEHAGRRAPRDANSAPPSWDDIARAHLELYAEVLGRMAA
jgi:glycosyltransferase involved in cell wall biosynthesis